MPRRAARLLAVVAVFVLLAAGCQEDNPETELPCDFYREQLETGAIEIDEVPEACREQLGEVTTSSGPGATTTTEGEAPTFGY